MIFYTLRRLGLMTLSLAGVITLSFLLVHLVPGDPVDMILGEQAASTDKDNLRKELGLHLPISEQYRQYVNHLIFLDMGRSLHTRDSVFSELISHFPATLELSIAALGLAILWGLPMGVWSAIGFNTWKDHFGNLLALFGMSLPGIFLGPLLIFIFAIKLDWLPVSDRGGLAHLILPAASLALPLGSSILRMTRASVLEVLRDDYMRTAKAKGLGPWRLYFKHALSNAIIPIITIIGLQLSALLTGTVVTETIFDWPGVGLLLFDSIQRRDYPMVQGTVLFIAVIYVTINLITDLLYGAANPQIREAHS